MVRKGKKGYFHDLEPERQEELLREKRALFLKKEETKKWFAKQDETTQRIFIMQSYDRTIESNKAEQKVTTLKVKLRRKWRENEGYVPSVGELITIAVYEIGMEHNFRKRYEQFVFENEMAFHAYINKSMRWILHNEWEGELPLELTRLAYHGIRADKAFYEMSREAWERDNGPLG